MDTTDKIDAIVCALSNVYLKKNYKTIDVTDLMRIVKIAMEYTERVTTDGSVKRIIVMRSVAVLLDRFVTDEKTRVFMKVMIPQIIDMVVDVSRDRWAINLKQRYKSCCL